MSPASFKEIVDEDDNDDIDIDDDDQTLSVSDSCCAVLWSVATCSANENGGEKDNCLVTVHALALAYLCRHLVISACHLAVSCLLCVVIFCFVLGL